MSTLAFPRRWSSEAAPFDRIKAVASLIAARLQRRIQILNDQRRLQAMPDYMLRDVGISREEIGSATEFGRIRRLGPSYRL